MWNRNKFTLQDSFVGNNFVGVYGVWGSENVEISIVNVYGPCDYRRRQEMWHEIMHVIQARGVIDGVWRVILTSCLLWRREGGMVLGCGRRMSMIFRILYKTLVLLICLS